MKRLLIIPFLLLAVCALAFEQSPNISPFGFRSGPLGTNYLGNLQTYNACITNAIYWDNDGNPRLQIDEFGTLFSFDANAQPQFTVDTFAHDTLIYDTDAEVRFSLDDTTLSIPLINSKVRFHGGTNTIRATSGNAEWIFERNSSSTNVISSGSSLRFYVGSVAYAAQTEQLSLNSSGDIAWTGTASGNGSDITGVASVTTTTSSDASSSVALFDSATGVQVAKTDPGLTYDSTTDTLSFGVGNVTTLRSIQTGNTNKVLFADANGVLTNLSLVNLTLNTGVFPATLTAAAASGGSSSQIGGSLFDTLSGTATTPYYSPPFGHRYSASPAYVSWSVGKACTLSNLWVNINDAGGASATYTYVICTNANATSGTFTPTHLSVSGATAVAGTAFIIKNTTDVLQVAEDISITLMATNTAAARTVYGGWGVQLGR